MNLKFDREQKIILTVLMIVFIYFVWYGYGYNKEVKARPANMPRPVLFDIFE